MDVAKKVILKNRKAAAIRAIRRAEEGLNEKERARLRPNLILPRNPLLAGKYPDPDVYLPQDINDELFLSSLLWVFILGCEEEKGG